MKLVVNFIAFQVGWFACVLGAANKMPWIGPLVCVPVIALHLFSVDKPRREINLIFSALGIGVVLDSLLVSSGWLSYSNGTLITGTAPYWILVMWALFASTLNVSLRWLRGRYALAAIFGAIGGPLSYLAGERLGAMSFNDTGLALLALAIGWGLAMPCLTRLAQRFDGVSVIQVRSRMEAADA